MKKPLKKTPPKKIPLKTLNRDEENNEFEIQGDTFKRYLSNAEHGYGYFHLTTWSRLCQMMEHVTVEDDNTKHRMLHLGSAVNMNDEYDKRCGKGVYFASFSFGPSENISMWTNYGIPNQEAVRVKFHTIEVFNWVKDFRAGKINVYGVNSDGSLTPLQEKPELIMSDVAYWSRNERWIQKEDGSYQRVDDPNDGIFIYDRNKFRITPPGNVERLKSEAPYLFKEAGWNYESETRIVLKFNNNLADTYKRVAVPFDEPLDYLDREFDKYVWRSPWNMLEEPKTKAADHSFSDAQESYYAGKINMRSVCDSCPKNDINKDKCTCPFHRQR